MWECVCERSAKSTAKLRLSRLVNRFHRIPLFLSCIVCLITHSMVMLESNADITQPCLTLDSTGKLCWLLPTQQLNLSALPSWMLNTQEGWSWKCLNDRRWRSYWFWIKSFLDLLLICSHEHWKHSQYVQCGINVGYKVNIFPQTLEWRKLHLDARVSV